MCDVAMVSCIARAFGTPLPVRSPLLLRVGGVSAFFVGVLGWPYPFRYVMTAGVGVVRCAADESPLCAPSGGIGELWTAW